MSTAYPSSVHESRPQIRARLLVIAGLAAAVASALLTGCCLDRRSSGHSGRTAAVQKIVFVRRLSPRPGDPGLYAVDTDGTGLSRLTQNHAEASPAWQPVARGAPPATNRG